MCRALGLLRICSLIGIVKGLNSGVISRWSMIVWAIVEALSGGGSHVTRLNFKTSRVGVFKCLLLIVGFAVTLAIWPREVVSCCDFILRAVATFLAMSLVRIYPGRASL